MGRVVDIPWVGGVNISWVGGRYTMGRRLDITWIGFSVSWVGVSKYHE